MARSLFFLALFLVLGTSLGQNLSTEGRNRGCPKGYKLADKHTCIRIMKKKPSTKCPLGFNAARKNGNAICKKISETEPEKKCQNGFTLNSAGQCEKKVEKPSKCPQGFTQDGDSCVKTATTKPTCPKGAVLKAGKCVSQETKPIIVNQSCRDGFQLGSDGKCRKQEAAIAFCKDGQLVDGARCKTTEFTGLTCADGYRLVNNRCEKRTGFVCKEGKLAGNKCIITSQRPAICPRPFVLVNGKCQQAVTEAPKVSCPLGGKFDSNTKKCIDSRPLQKSCREGFSGPDSNGKCTKRSIDVKAAECREGKPEGNRCRIESHPQQAFECRDGLKLEGNNCVGDKIVPAIKKCSGWGNYDQYNDAKKCYHHDVDPKEWCPSNYHRERKHKNGKDFWYCRCRSNDRKACKYGHETPAKCFPGFHELTQADKDKIKSSKNYECIKREHEVKPQLTCPSKAFRLQGDKCVQHRGIIIPAIKKLACKKEQGQLVNGRICVRFVNKTCPSGYHLRDGKCFRTIITTEDAKAVCPSGFHQRGNLCVRVTNPKIECSSGLRFDSKAFVCRGLKFTPVICEAGLKLQGNVCVGTTTVDAQCPSGFQSSGRDCVAFRDAMCPAGYTRQGDKCAKDSFAPAEFRCASRSATLQGKLCITIENATVTKTCPEGFTQKGDSCVREQITDAQCPADFELQGDVCEKEESADPVCPKSFTLTDAGVCEKIQTRAPRLTCENGKPQKGTCKTVTFEDAELFCEDEGFKLEKGVCYKKDTVDRDLGKH